LNGSKIGFLLLNEDTSFVLLKMLYFILKFSLIKFETPDVLISTLNSFIVTTDNSDWLLKKSLWTLALASIEAYPLKVAVLN